MPSNFDCLGLGVADEQQLWALVDRTLPESVPIGNRPGIRRWQDPSGVRIVFELSANRTIAGILPTFAGRAGALLGEVTALTDELAAADVVDREGDTVTRLAVSLEQRRLLPKAPAAVAGPASIVALGLDVRAHPSPAAFEESDDSLLVGSADTDASPGGREPEPLRLAAESLLPYGLFSDPAEPDAYARVSGTVLAVGQRHVALTGRDFTVVRLRTVGLELDLCLAGTDRGVTVNGVLSGTVLLTGSLPHLETPA